MEIKGKIYRIGDIQEVGSNGFTKREVVIETEEQYPQFINIEFHKDKATHLDQFAVGNIVEVSINLRGRLWTSPQGVEKCFNTLQGWRIGLFQDGTKPAETTKAVEVAQQAGAIQSVDEDDLPF